MGTYLAYVIRWKKGAQPCSLSLPIDDYSPNDCYAFEEDIRRDDRHRDVTGQIEELVAQ